MNEFEWRRQMRELRQPVAPGDHLWARIDAALDASANRTDESIAPVATHRRRRWPVVVGMAATLVLAGGIGWHLRQHMTSDASPPRIVAVTPWKPADPRLAGAAIELHAAQIELRQAIRQAPGSPMLQRLLARTEQQQASLRRFERNAG